MPFYELSWAVVGEPRFGRRCGLKSNLWRREWRLRRVEWEGDSGGESSLAGILLLLGPVAAIVTESLGRPDKRIRPVLEWELEDAQRVVQGTARIAAAPGLLMGDQLSTNPSCVTQSTKVQETVGEVLERAAGWQAVEWTMFASLDGTSHPKISRDPCPRGGEFALNFSVLRSSPATCDAL